VRRAALMADGPVITPEDLELATPEPAARPAMTGADFDLRAARLRAERDTIERALAHSRGSVSAAARLLGISRPTLYGLLETHGMATSRQASDGAEPPEATLDAV
jgi:two-component system NtrC family response regulator